jgi:hypothetical protein
MGGTVFHVFKLKMKIQYCGSLLKIRKKRLYQVLGFTEIGGF